MHNYKNELFIIYVLIYDMLKETKFMLLTTEILDKNDWYTGLTVAGTGDKILMSHDCTIAMFFYIQSRSIVSTRDLNQMSMSKVKVKHMNGYDRMKKLQARVMNFN